MKSAQHWLRLVVIPLLLAAFPPAVLAQDYPSRTVRLTVPFPPGGAADLLARLLAQSLSESLGQQFIVENRPGGNTIIAASAVANSTPDGHTLLMVVDSTLTMNKSLYKNLPYDPVGDFAPVTLLAQQPLLLSANPKVPFKSLAEMVGYAKSNPGVVNIGVGALVSRVAAELLKQTSGADLTVVPYAGSAPSRQALLAGDVQVSFSDVASPAPFLRDGRMLAIATTGSERALAGVPTIKETYPDYEVKSWYALVVPAGTPNSTIAKLNAEVGKALRSPSIKARLETLGLEMTPSSPKELARMVERESKKWAALIEATGLKLE